MLFSILSALTLAMAADTKKVVVYSSNSELTGKGINDIHFGAGMNGVLIVDEPTEYLYNDTENFIYKTYVDDEYYVYFGVDENELIGSYNTGPVTNYSDLKGMTDIKSNFLTYNGSSSVFYACSPLSFDPYGYTKNGTKGVAVYTESDSVPSGCDNIILQLE